MKRADVFIIAGQSNALGISPNAGLGALCGKIYPNIEIFFNTNYQAPMANEWREMSTHFGQNEARFGLEVGVSEVLQPRYTAERKAYLIKYASDGTALYDRWNKSSTAEDYDGLIDTIKRGVTALKEKEIEADVKGMIWFQGCTDAIFKDAAETYERNLTNLIANFRSDVKADLPLSIAQINKHNERLPYRDTVIEAQKRVAERTDGCIYLETGEFTSLIDNYHYDADGMLELGKRLATNLLRIIK